MPKRSLWTRGFGCAGAVAVMACLVFSAPLSAMTFSTPKPDAWFSVWVQIRAKSLPPGVKFKRASFSDRDVGYFVNSSRTPFYLVTKPGAPPWWARDLPHNVVPNQASVLGAVLRMDGWKRTWRRESRKGISLGRFLRPTADKAVRILEMNAYLGKRKITVRGRYVMNLIWNHPEQLELDTPLPAPIRVVESGGTFAIVNDGAIPLYTVDVYPKPRGWVTEVPFGYLATHKLVAGRTYYGARILPSSGDGWDEVPPHDARLTEREFEIYIPGFKLRQVYRDNRPRHVKVPAPQPFRMTAFYGRRKVVIRGRVLYDLNPNYDPIASRRPPVCQSCTGEEMCGMCAKLQGPRRPHRKPPRHSPTY